MVQSPIPLLGFAAWSGTGKTTLLTQLLPILKRSGLRIGIVKHAHHRFETDIPGKDSYELRKSGAEQVLVTSQKRWALMCDRHSEKEPELQEELARFNLNDLDLMLVEGFKHESFYKIELHRPEVNKPLIHPEDENIIAVASTTPIQLKKDLPFLDMNNIQQIADFVIAYCNKG